MGDYYYILCYYYFAAYPHQPCTHLSARLTFRSADSTGLVEVCNRNIWSVACADAFGINEARVICRQLGFNSTYVNYTQLQHVQIINSIEIQGELVPVDLVPIFDEFVGCLGNEASLAECQGRILTVTRRKRGLSLEVQPTCQYRAGVQCGGIYY